MGGFLIFTPSKTERSAIMGQLTLLLRQREIPEKPELIALVEELANYPARAALVLVCDVTVRGALPVLEQLRRENPELRLIAVADGSISPMEYIRPTIQPVALMLRPLNTDLIHSTLADVLRLLPSGVEPKQESDCFTLELRGHLQRIAYQEILYFEARNKRLILHQRRREIPFGGTLEKLEEELPAGFLRTHKSFIINTGAVLEIQYGQNQVILEGNVAIPLSRSYKSKVKAVFS